MTQISLPLSTTLTSCDVFPMLRAWPTGRVRSLNAAILQNGVRVKHSTSAQNGSVLTLPRRSSFPRNCRTRYSDYISDIAQVAQGIVVNDKLDPNVINANKHAFVDQFVNRPEFTAIYGGLTSAQFVDKLSQTTGVALSASDRQALIDELNASASNKSDVVFKVVDGTQTITDGALVFQTSYGQAFYNQEFDAAFVFMEYIAYLRRNPDQDGYDFWLAKLKRYGNWVDAQMVLAFIKSPEYRDRF